MVKGFEHLFLLQIPHPAVHGTLLQIWGNTDRVPVEDLSCFSLPYCTRDEVCVVDPMSQEEAVVLLPGWVC